VVKDNKSVNKVLKEAKNKEFVNKVLKNLKELVDDQALYEREQSAKRYGNAPLEDLQQLANDQNRYERKNLIDAERKKRHNSHVEEERQRDWMKEILSQSYQQLLKDPSKGK